MTDINQSASQILGITPTPILNIEELSDDFQRLADDLRNRATTVKHIYLSRTYSDKIIESMGKNPELTMIATIYRIPVTVINEDRDYMLLYST